MSVWGPGISFHCVLCLLESIPMFQDRKTKSKKTCCIFQTRMWSSSLKNLASFPGLGPRKHGSTALSPSGVTMFKILPCPIREWSIPGTAGDSGVFHSRISDSVRLFHVHEDSKRESRRSQAERELAMANCGCTGAPPFPVLCQTS